MKFDETFLARWIAGGLTDPERKAFERHPDYPAYTKLVDSVSRWKVSATDEEKLLEKIRAAIQNERENTAEQILSNPKGRIIRLSWMARAAAIALILAACVWGYALSGRVQNATQNAEWTQIALPDGSSVTLNAASTLKYNKNTWSFGREVSFDGEGYFEVEKGEKIFRVNTAAGQVEVLGTKFNVRIREDNTLAVTCLEGRVRVKSPDEKSFRILEKGQSAAVVGQIVKPVTIDNPTKAISWKNGDSQLEQASFDYIAGELERTYGVKVEFDRPQMLEGRRFTLVVVRDNLRQTVSDLHSAIGNPNINYDITPGLVRFYTK